MKKLLLTASVLGALSVGQTFAAEPMLTTTAISPTIVDATANTSTLYQQGYSDAVKMCLATPDKCGIVMPMAVFEQGTLNVPIVVVPGAGCFGIKLPLIDPQNWTFSLDLTSITVVDTCMMPQAAQ